MGLLADVLPAVYRFGDRAKKRVNSILDTQTYRNALNYDNFQPLTEQELVDGLLGFGGVMGTVKPIFKSGLFKSPGISGLADLPPIDGVAITPSKKVGLLDNDMSIRQLVDGSYVVERSPSWGSKDKPFYGIGDDAQALIDAARQRSAKSSKALELAAKRKHEATLLGRLQKEYGDTFKAAKSTQSNSQYITHTPSGMKIRISDHPLPLHYEQPDLDLPLNGNLDDAINQIRKLLGY